jgi:predicted acetyltransferase
MARLLQLYCYDFSEIVGLEIGHDGRFALPRPDSYWRDGRYAAFLIHAGGHLAGFAIVDSVSRLTGERVHDMNEFFVLRRHRRAGVGARAARLAFEAFPGRWEVREAALNTPAQAFWRTVIARFTGAPVDEVTLDDERWRGPVQRFVSPAR